MGITRRDALKAGTLTGLAAVGLSVPLGRGVLARSASLLDKSLMPQPYRSTFTRPPVLQPVATGVDSQGPYARYDVQQRGGFANIISSRPTEVWGYGGAVPGPTIHVERGTRIEMLMRNRLPAVHPRFGYPFLSSTHLHGSASLPQYDGYASDIARPGQVKRYEWPNSQPARTLWYHDHAVHTTAQNVVSGLAAQYHLHDAAERALLPQGAYDVPLTVSDVMFAADGGLHYDDRDHSGLYGDVILVNGRPWPVMRVQRRVYRFRLLNASVSRSYRFQLSPQVPVHMVATDGGIMPRSRQVTTWRQASAERYEFLVDFRQFAVGQRVELRNLSNENNRDFDHTNKVMAFDVTGGPVDTSDPHAYALPDLLVPSEVMNLQPSQSKRNRQMRLKKSDVTGLWSINDRTWNDVIASGYREVFANPGLNDVETWTIENKSGGWHHPLHIHLIDFKVLSRNGRAPFAYEQGPKDVVYVGEGETVRVIAKFGPHRGKYMIHCHNLPHEDHDMMVQYSVGLSAGQVDPNDPLTADPAQDDAS